MLIIFLICISVIPTGMAQTTVLGVVKTSNGRCVDFANVITRVRDNESPNGCSEKRHRLSGDPVGSPDFYRRVYRQKTSCPLDSGTS